MELYISYENRFNVWRSLRTTTTIFENKEVGDPVLLQGFVLTDIVTREANSRGSLLFQETSQ